MGTPDINRLLDTWFSNLLAFSANVEVDFEYELYRLQVKNPAGCAELIIHWCDRLLNESPTAPSAVLLRYVDALKKCASWALEQGYIGSYQEDPEKRVRFMQALIVIAHTDDGDDTKRLLQECAKLISGSEAPHLEGDSWAAILGRHFFAEKWLIVESLYGATGLDVRSVIGGCNDYLPVLVAALQTSSAGHAFTLVLPDNLTAV